MGGRNGVALQLHNRRARVSQPFSARLPAVCVDIRDCHTVEGNSAVVAGLPSHNCTSRHELNRAPDSRSAEGAKKVDEGCAGFSGT